MTSFLIGSSASSDPDNWSSVATLLSTVSSDITAGRALEWEHQDYASYEKLGSGKTRGLGLPIVRWTFKALRPEQRENLRDFCTGMSAEVYIRTPTNETAAGVRTWKDYGCIMTWVERAELVGIEHVEEVVLTFTNCIVVPA